jgi:hypothetical protein
MKNLLRSLGPLNIIRRLILMVKEFYFFFVYKKSLKKLEPQLKERNIVKSSNSSLIKSVNLKPETLLLANKAEAGMSDDDKNELKKLELSFVSKEIAKQNDIFIEEGVIELIKTEATRVKTSDYYGYLVEISFKWKDAKLYQVLRVIFQLSLWIVGLLLIPYKTIFNYVVSLF